MLAEAPGGEEGTYLLEQRFRYAYATPVRRLRHRLVVVPRAVHGDQRLVDHELTVSGGPVLVSSASDDFGNHVVELRAPEVDDWIEFEVWSLVRRSGPGGTVSLPPASIGDPRLLASTPLTRAEGPLAEAARELVGTGARGLELAERACTWARRSLAYEYGITGVRTTAAAAVAGGRGVCQDYAHVMIALCRAAGLPARYVSGHLVGEGGSHAWVEVVSSSSGNGRAVAVAFDPTHDRRARRGYLTVAVGRDYSDVAPTSGTFEGLGPGVLSATKRLAIVEPAPARTVSAWSP